MPVNKNISLHGFDGLTFDFLSNGIIKDIHVGPIRINLRAANPFGKMGTNFYLRRRESTIRYKALFSSASTSHYDLEENSFQIKGSWDGIDYICKLQLSCESHSWQWSIELCNTSKYAADLDLIYLQDIGLEPTTGGQVNEYYISQYIERRVLKDTQYGSVICCRQNAKGPTGNPWFMMACKNSAVAASVDGMQFYGSAFTETDIPHGLLENELGGEYSGELAILGLQETPFTLAPNSAHISSFVAHYTPDHSQATSCDDLKQLPFLMQEFQQEDFRKVLKETFAPQENIFRTSPLFKVDDLSDQDLDTYFGKNKRHMEEEGGQLLSFFCKDNTHVVLRQKESIAERPHAHIMQAQTGYVPDENIMTTTCYMYGVFNSHMTQGNTNFNRLLSVNSSQFNLETQTGQRIFIEIDGQIYRLGVPSAFEMGLNSCRWIYKQADHCFQVRTWTSKVAPQVNMDFKILSGSNVNLIITNHFDAANAWHFASKNIDTEIVIKPDYTSLIASKFPHAQFRIVIQGDALNCTVNSDEILYNNCKGNDPAFLIISAKDTSDFCMSFIGEVLQKSKTIKIKNTDKQWSMDCLNAQEFWTSLSSNLALNGEHEDLRTISEIIPWYGVNALTHLLTPHGLEQFDGAAWGTRDTVQGPFELLLSMRKFDAAKEILRLTFSNQNTDGGWPQWWMFDSYTNHRSTHSHGDIFHWCLIALSDYIKASGDTAFLNEILPYHHPDGVKLSERTPLSEHVSRLISMITNSFISGTSLVPFGGGDWNDSMQPVSHELAQRLVSAWTVELNYQAFTAYQKIYILTGNHEQAERLASICAKIKMDFNTYLVKDGVVAGHGLLEGDGTMDLLLHPDDTKTNIQYRLLSMIRGVISGIFTQEQTQQHLGLIEEHLKGPDGARLMNRPHKYKGGIQSFFQRAESSPYFGREVGIMYTHAHLRYAQTQAITGRAEAFFKALRQANPVAYRDIVSCGDIRQANCYYSSSDATFENRYEADYQYSDLKEGKITLKGGWRIYSSGPGIYISLIVSHLLGMRDAFGNTVIDPVIPHQMDGMSASWTFMDRNITFLYTVNEDCAGPKTISINAIPIDFKREENQYRLGGALIPTEKFLTLLNQDNNIIEVQL